MNPLLRVLQQLKPGRSWYIFVSPDPRHCRGFQLISKPDQYLYDLRLETDADLDKYFRRNPTFHYAINAGQSSQQNVLRPNKKIRTDWVSIVDTGRKTADGQTVDNVLLRILDGFPSYHLHSEQGVQAAILDIEAKISSVASSEEVSNELDD